MKICIGFHGQLRSFKKIGADLKSKIIDPNNECIILFSTWEHEPINDFIEVFPEAYIKQFKIETQEDFKWDPKSRMDPGNPNKTILNFWRYQKSLENLNILINEYENETNLEFDIILRIRTDVQLTDYIYQYYSTVIDNNIYVPSEPNYPIYNKPAYPDFLAFGKNKEMKNILNGIKIIEECTHEPNTFHPETVAYGIINYYNYNCNYLPFSSYIVY